MTTPDESSIMLLCSENRLAETEIPAMSTSRSDVVDPKTDQTLHDLISTHQIRSKYRNSATNSGIIPALWLRVLLCNPKFTRIITRHQDVPVYLTLHEFDTLLSLFGDVLSNAVLIDLHVIVADSYPEMAHVLQTVQNSLLCKNDKGMTVMNLTAFNNATNWLNFDHYAVTKEVIEAILDSAVVWKRGGKLGKGVVAHDLNTAAKSTLKFKEQEGFAGPFPTQPTLDPSKIIIPTPKYKGKSVYRVGDVQVDREVTVMKTPDKSVIVQYFDVLNSYANLKKTLQKAKKSVPHEESVRTKHRLFELWLQLPPKGEGISVLEYLMLEPFKKS